ncbi:MAG: LPS-assembly protein LptD [Campylobacterota bacterium]|nr:LPS-assembly protein LptD [Campylobacterota bacterium]
MRKYFLIITVVLFGWVNAGEKIEIMAEDLSATDSIIIAKGNVVVHYDDSVIQSSMAHYDRKKHILTLSGDNIELMGYKGSKIKSRELQINTKSKKVTFKNLFLTDDNDIWVFADSATKEDDNITFGPSIMSSCDVKSRDWALYADSSKYDGEAHYMRMKDVKVEFWDVPLFYTPYLAFSTHKERSSGILFPSFGYTSNTGLVYEQPLYWAPSRSWDVELRPQIRTKAGEGIYGTVRFADSPYSAGAIRVGYFRDREKYVEEHNVKNRTHYGFEMLYDSSKVLDRFISAGDDVVDGLYINATLLNDIDYIYLQKKPMSHFGAVPLQESRFNYFVHNDDYSAGLYAKYFIDTRLLDNNTTMQILPTLQLHKYLKPIILDKLTYSMDLTMNNYTRKEGTTLRVAEFYAPIEFTHSFFDDFLSLSLKEDLYYNQLMYGNGDYTNDDYQYYNNVSRVKLFSDLTKKYSSFAHVIQPSLTYSLPGNGVESPVEFEKLEEDQKRLFAPGVEEENLALKFSQYLYNDEGELTFYERLTQFYHPDREFDKFGDLGHEIQYNIAEWKLYNSLIYSYEFKKLKEMSSAIRWEGEGYRLSLTHSYQRLYSYSESDEVIEEKKHNDVNLNVVYQITNRVGLAGGFIYNIDDEFHSQWRFGMNYNKDCWNVSLGFRQDVRPTATTHGANSILDNSFSFQLNFVPFGGVGVSSSDVNQFQ